MNNIAAVASVIVLPNCLLCTIVNVTNSTETAEVRLIEDILSCYSSQIFVNELKNHIMKSNNVSTWQH